MIVTKDGVIQILHFIYKRSLKPVAVPESHDLEFIFTHMIADREIKADQMKAAPFIRFQNAEHHRRRSPHDGGDN